MTVRVILYGRVSTDMQTETGLSIPARLNEMREFAERRGWTIVGEFVDPGFSGSSLYQAVSCEVALDKESHSAATEWLARNFPPGSFFC